MRTPRAWDLWRILLSCWMLLVLCGAAPVSAQTPNWIWDSPAAPQVEGRRVLFFRKTFRTPPLLWNARLTAAADDSADVFSDGVLVATCERWDRQCGPKSPCV